MLPPEKPTHRSGEELPLAPTRESPHEVKTQPGQKHTFISLGVPGGQTVKNPPALQETRVRSLGQGDPLEKGMATHSSIVAWRIPRTEEPAGLQTVG